MADINIQLPALDSASILDGTDLFHIRQGAIDKKVDLDTIKADFTPADVGALPDTLVINTTAPLTGGGTLASTVTLDISAATSTAKGVVELATNTETVAGTDTTRAVTPAGVAAIRADLTPAEIGALDDSLGLSTTAPLNGGGTLASGLTLGINSSTTTAKGVVELATSAETINGTDTTRAVTPSGLSTLTSTDTRRGLVELATTSEAAAGTDTTRAVTPAGLQAKFNTIPSATTAIQGLIEIASSAEVAAGADNTRALTPSNLKQAFSGNKATNGYIQLPNGWLVQWMLVLESPNSSTQRLFPLPFPTNCLHIQATNHTGSSNNAVKIVSYDANGAVLLIGNEYGNPATCFVFAVGY